MLSQLGKRRQSGYYLWAWLALFDRIWVPEDEELAAGRCIVANPLGGSSPSGITN